MREPAYLEITVSETSMEDAPAIEILPLKKPFLQRKGTSKKTSDSRSTLETNAIAPIFAPAISLKITPESEYHVNPEAMDKP